MLGGNIKDKALTELRDALRDCMTIEDGKFSFDKKKAPPLNHPIEVAEFLDTLKEEFIGTTAGATHVSMEVIPVPIESYSANIVQTGETDTEARSHSGIPSPQSVESGQQQPNTVETSPSAAEEGTQFIDAQADILLFSGE
jgi:hypothetical protein